ncbi:gluconate 2-dehydrogenase subunit 3 family protein [Rathayibacter sp. KR2-224]|uniref:gluconate 2-dehydrogenase subunit 3 family protein n=1 Tax=Rathayibacter sp. KR2-224 TaxID=3400913 RepID=UPI003C0A7101
MSRHPRNRPKSTLPLSPENGGGRFPGFDVMGQEPHWDGATRAAIHARLHGQPAVRFFTQLEVATAKCLLDRLVGQRAEPGDETVDLARMVDARLAENQTDGWHYDTMPRDSEAWRASLRALNEDAHDRFGSDFAECDLDQQRELMEAVRTWGEDRWHELPPAQVWSLWTRYAATAFYSHPAVWNEIGFGGPAYPRGYKDLGIDRREPYEVKDARPSDDPLRRPGPPQHGKGGARRTTGQGGSAAASGRDSGNEGRPGGHDREQHDEQHGDHS